MTKTRVRWFLTGVILLLLIVSIQGLYDTLYPYPELPEFHYIPSGEIIRQLVPHMAQMTADVYWIKAVLYFGRTKKDLKGGALGHSFLGKIRSDSLSHLPRVIPSYRLLSDLLNTAVSLDPYFLYAYLFGGLFLSMEGGLVDEAIDLLERGQVLFPDVWRFPFLLGFNYFFFKSDPSTSLKEFVRAASKPGRPAIIYNLIESIARKNRREDIAVTFLEGAVMTTKDPKMRAELEQLLEKIKKEKHIQE